MSEDFSFDGLDDTGPSPLNVCMFAKFGTRDGGAYAKPAIPF